MLSGLGAVEIVSHRVLWCVVFMILLLTINREWLSVRTALYHRRTLIALFASSVLVSINWSMYVFSIISNQLIASSLGYFLSPLVSVFLGFIFLKERLSWIQWLAVFLAACAVSNQFISYGDVPWIAVTIAFTFGLYGLIRKTVHANSGVGLFIECLLLTPFCLSYLLWLEWQGIGSFPSEETNLNLLLISAGIITGFPLLMYAAGARRIRLTTIGLFQYFTPSTYLVIAVYFFGESFTLNEWITFGLLWIGLFIYSVEVWRTRLV